MFCFFVFFVFQNFAAQMATGFDEKAGGAQMGVMQGPMVRVVYSVVWHTGSNQVEPQLDMLNEMFTMLPSCGQSLLIHRFISVCPFCLLTYHCKFHS